MKYQITKEEKRFFQSKILEFSQNSSYDHLWKQDKNPYSIWLFEVIMQQTRMEQGRPYFDKIYATFPTLKSLAESQEEDLFKLWKGLGYYSRARNLLSTAKFIHYELHGDFPKTATDLKKLKGIGDYTAAAIASFAYGEDVAVLDGNVHRVLSRYFLIDKTIESNIDKKFYTDLSQELLIKGKSDIYNQAMMDLGSKVCKPQNPTCEFCPLQTKCGAFLTQKIKEFPPKKVKIKLKKRYFFNLFIQYEDEILIQKRDENDVWKGLYQGVLIEINDTPDAIILEHKLDLNKVKWSDWEEQKLSHQHIYMKFGILKIDSKIYQNTMKWISKSKIMEIPFPKIIDNWVKNHLIVD